MTTVYFSCHIDPLVTGRTLAAPLGCGYPVGGSNAGLDKKMFGDLHPNQPHQCQVLPAALKWLGCRGTRVLVMVRIAA